MTRRDKRLLKLYEDSLRAQAAGVVLRLDDWKKMDADHQRAWLAARKVASMVATGTNGADPDENVPAVPAADEIDFELRSVLEHGRTY